MEFPERISKLSDAKKNIAPVNKQFAVINGMKLKENLIHSHFLKQFAWFIRNPLVDSLKK